MNWEEVENRIVVQFSGASFDISNCFQRISDAHTSPSAIYRPSISIDGNKWCALYGENPQDGVAGFGDTPGEAMADFDKNWWAALEGKVSQ
jgi:hypothetical protein